MSVEAEADKSFEENLLSFFDGTYRVLWGHQHDGFSQIVSSIQ